MKVTFNTHAAKFLSSCDERNQGRIRTKIKELVTSIGQQGIIPFRELRIRILA
jgi:hypothetical protein